MTDRMSDLVIFERQIDKMITYIPRSAQTVDVMDLFFRMTLDVTTDFLLGESANSLDKLVTQDSFPDLRRSNADIYG